MLIIIHLFLYCYFDVSSILFFLINILLLSQHSQSRYGLESQRKSLFYFFVRLYAILCTVTEPIVFNR